MELANEIFEAINNYNNKQIKTVVVNSELWFCGRDIATILEYSNKEKAVRMHVKDKNKSSYRNLICQGTLSSAVCPPTAGGRELQGVQRLTYSNDMKTIYINEKGLYSLIMKSQQALAEQFQEWVTDDLLPTLRKNGSYQLENKVKQYEQQLEQTKQQLAESERRQLRLNDFIRSTSKLEKNEIIYIGTTHAYQNQHRFKVGGCSSFGSLSGRFSTYNSGRTVDDSFFCGKYWKVTSYTLIEKIVKTLLEEFKDRQGNDKEMYHIHGESLLKALEFIISNSDENVDWINEHLFEFTNNTINNEPFSFKPIQLKQSLRITAGKHSIDVADITGWTEEQIEMEIQSILSIYKSRRQLNDFNNQIVVWKDLSLIIKEKHKHPRMMDWRDAFKVHIPRRSERLKIKGLGSI